MVSNVRCRGLRAAKATKQRPPKKTAVRPTEPKRPDRFHILIGRHRFGEGRSGAARLALRLAGLYIDLMALNIEMRWMKPVRLRSGAREGLIYTCDLDRFYREPGVYVFARAWAEQFTPIYIGQAQRVRGRIRQQLDSVRLMNGVADASLRGRRYVLHAYVQTKPGQQVSRVLRTVETALIDTALSNGHTLVNVQGVKPHTHTVSFSGNREATNTFRPLIRVRAR